SVQAPANLGAIVSAVTAPAASVASLVSSLGGTLPALSTATSALTSTLQGALGTVSALAGGATIKLGELTSSSDFAPQGAVATPTASGAPGAPAPSGELPRTGQDNAPLAV